MPPGCSSHQIPKQLLLWRGICPQVLDVGEFPAGQGWDGRQLEVSGREADSSSFDGL